MSDAGVNVIQFDEPAFNVYMDEVRDWGVAALEKAAQGLRSKTAVHICYGYGIKANIEWKKTLGSEWRQYEQTFPLLAASALGVAFAGPGDFSLDAMLGFSWGEQWGVAALIVGFLAGAAVVVARNAAQHRAAPPGGTPQPQA